MKWNELSNTLIITERKVNDINTIKSKISNSKEKSEIKLNEQRLAFASIYLRAMQRVQQKIASDFLILVMQVRKKFKHYF